MGRRHTINYKPSLIIAVVVLIFASLVLKTAWEESIETGIIIIIAFIGVSIFGLMMGRASERVKSVVITSNAITMEYRKTNVIVPFEVFSKLKHYKHGPFTERILVHAKDDIYLIPGDLKDFQDMCRSIYVELSKIDKEHIADEWFQKKFGNGVSLKTSSIESKREVAGEKYSANYSLMWILYVLQFILVCSLIYLIWSNKSIVDSLIMTIPLLFVEYLGVLAILSPRIIKSVTITATTFIIDFKKERVEIPIKSCELVHYHRPWPSPKRVYICTEQKFQYLLPWYIKNFRRMGKSIYQALENAQKESVASKQFKRKFGKRKYKKVDDI